MYSLTGCLLVSTKFIIIFIFLYPFGVNYSPAARQTLKPSQKSTHKDDAHQSTYQAIESLTSTDIKDKDA